MIETTLENVPYNYLRPFSKYKTSPRTVEDQLDRKMEDPNFFFYANLLYKPHGFSLDTDGNNLLWRIWSFVGFFTLEVMLAMVIVNIFYKYPDVDLMVANSTAVFGFLVNTFKICTTFFRIHQYADFVAKLKDSWEITTKEETKLLMQHKFFVKVISLINFISLTLGITWWLLLPPVFSTLEEYRTGVDARWIPPYNISYIEPIKDSPGYSISITLFFIFSMIDIVGGCGFDSFFLESCLFLSSHFDVIRERFQAVKFTQSSEDNGSIKSQISSIVVYHNKILDICIELQELVKTAVFPFLLFDSILICTCFYTVIKISDISKTLAFAGLSIATVAQIYVLTYSGDYLYSKSKSICQGIYDSNWYEGCPGQRRYLLPCMAKGAKGIIFTMGLFDLSLTTLTLILQTAGSYIALLKSISS